MREDTREAPEDPDRLLTTSDVATRLNVGERYVRRLVAERRIGYLKVGAKLRFAREDVDSFVSSSRVLTVTTRRWEELHTPDAEVKF